MPKSQVRKKKVYTPPTDVRPTATAATRKPSPVWLPVTAVALIVAGIGWLVVYYLSEQEYPVRVGLLEPRGGLRRDGRLPGAAVPLALTRPLTGAHPATRSRSSRAPARRFGAGPPMVSAGRRGPGCEKTHVTVG